MTMKMKLPFLVILLLAFLVAPSYAEVFIAPTSGYIDRTSNAAFSMDGTFRFLNEQNDFNGIVQPRTNGADGTFTFCDFSGTPCTAGQTIRIRDFFTSISGLRPGTSPAVINGTNFNVLIYKTNLTFDGGTVRIPYNLARRQSFKITVRSTASGTMTGYTNVSMVNPLFTANINLQGTVTVYFTRKSDAIPASYYVSRVIHNYPAS
jgi:hypothetical protein